MCTSSISVNVKLVNLAYFSWNLILVNVIFIVTCLWPNRGLIGTLTLMKPKPLIIPHWKQSSVLAMMDLITSGRAPAAKLETTSSARARTRAKFFIVFFSATRRTFYWSRSLFKDVSSGALSYQTGWRRGSFMTIVHFLYSNLVNFNTLWLCQNEGLNTLVDLAKLKTWKKQKRNKWQSLVHIKDKRIPTPGFENSVFLKLIANQVCGLWQFFKSLWNSTPWVFEIKGFCVLSCIL